MDRREPKPAPALPGEGVYACSAARRSCAARGHTSCNFEAGCIAPVAIAQSPFLLHERAGQWRRVDDGCSRQPPNRSAMPILHRCTSCNQLHRIAALKQRGIVQRPLCKRARDRGAPRAGPPSVRAPQASARPADSADTKTQAGRARAATTITSPQLGKMRVSPTHAHANSQRCRKSTCARFRLCSR